MADSYRCLMAFDEVRFREGFQQISFPGIQQGKKATVEIRQTKEGKNRLNSNEATFLQPGAIRESKRGGGVASPHKGLLQLLKV